MRRNISAGPNRQEHPTAVPTKIPVLATSHAGLSCGACQALTNSVHEQCLRIINYYRVCLFPRSEMIVS